VLTPRPGRAVARALIPAALLATSLGLGTASAEATVALRPIATTVVTQVAVPVAVVPANSAALIAARRAALARAAAAHRALVLRRTNSVVVWALHHVGAHYVAGATGPWGFDCSGLTLAAWRTQGAHLPHYSAAQYNVIRHVPLRALRPGDLLFYFRNGAHHVAIYVGHGLMVSADHSSVGVRLEPFLFSWFGAHFTGVGRVLN
jgi:cell wall-associated NlpC family hydrolase